MKRMLLTLAVLGLGGVSSSRADWGGYVPPAPQNGYGPPTVPGEFNQPNTFVGMMAGASNKAPDRYGLMPGLRKVFRIGGDGCDTCTGGGKAGLFSKFGGGSTCNTCGIGAGRAGHPWGHGGGHAGHGGYGYDYPQYPPVMQGTLVFPNHQYMRSPRDFFMYEPGR